MTTCLFGRLVLQPSTVCIGLKGPSPVSIGLETYFAKQAKDRELQTTDHRRETSIGLENHFLLTNHRLVLPLATHLVSNKLR